HCPGGGLRWAQTPAYHGPTKKDLSPTEAPPDPQVERRNRGRDIGVSAEAGPPRSAKPPADHSRPCGNLRRFTRSPQSRQLSPSPHHPHPPLLRPNPTGRRNVLHRHKYRSTDGESSRLARRHHDGRHH